MILTGIKFQMSSCFKLNIQIRQISLNIEIMFQVTEIHYQHQHTSTYMELPISKAQECKQDTNYNLSLFHHRGLRDEGLHCFHRSRRGRSWEESNVISIHRHPSIYVLEVPFNDTYCSFKKITLPTKGKYLWTQYPPPHLHYLYFYKKENTHGFKVCS